MRISACTIKCCEGSPWTELPEFIEREDISPEEDGVFRSVRHCEIDNDPAVH